MLAEAEAEMSALEMDLDEFQEMSSMENPPNNLVDFANQVRNPLSVSRWFWQTDKIEIDVINKKK